MVLLSFVFVPSGGIIMTADLLIQVVGGAAERGVVLQPLIKSLIRLKHTAEV